MGSLDDGAAAGAVVELTSPTSRSAASESIPGPTSGKAARSRTVTPPISVSGCPRRPTTTMSWSVTPSMSNSSSSSIPRSAPTTMSTSRAVRRPGSSRQGATSTRSRSPGCCECRRPITGATSAAPPHGPTPMCSSPSSIPFAKRISRSRSRVPGVERPRVSQQQPSHVGGLDARRTAVEQRRAHLRLQRLDAARQGRLGDVRRGGRPAEVAVLGDGDQVSKAAQFHVDHHAICAWR